MHVLRLLIIISNQGQINKTFTIQSLAMIFSMSDREWKMPTLAAEGRVAHDCLRRVPDIG